MVNQYYGNSVIVAQRDGDAWKWRLLSISVAPPTVNLLRAYPTATPD
jgi:hypothetical protein